jgi:hypothetical protein
VLTRINPRRRRRRRLSANCNYPELIRRIEHDLVRNPAKEKDPNLANFADTLTADEADEGLGVQIEVDALEPGVHRIAYRTR